jgi:hypothetical protein
VGWALRNKRSWVRWLIVFLLVGNIALLPIDILSIDGRIQMSADQGLINLVIQTFFALLCLAALLLIRAARDMQEPPPLGSRD